ncbi:large exoprotein [Microbacterium sp. CIAB417]|uniref:large exoprotein n=1 Tax=Microbacterium sp. CIAB417 TaxID=2860287 RepID=UPI001FACAD5C|nr:large exoprotein [Microbacterium sp. CIAB417]
MGGQVLGGGVIFLVAVTLWLLYLLPSWHSRHQYNAAERNAVRLNQALRVLAETSETPEEVRLELTARTASAQQKLARQTLAERERAQLEVARQELAAAKQEARAVRERPEVRMARARRRARLTATVLALLSLAGAGLGIWVQLTMASATVLWASGTVFVVSVLMLQQMSRVARRAARRVAPAPHVAVETRQAHVQDVALPTRSAPATWEPRSLPRPLAATSGSRASLVQDAADAREALRRAAVEEAKRERAEQAAPPSIDTARVAKAPEESPFARMGYVDDAEIEDHVRRLLSTRRAAG